MIKRGNKSGQFYILATIVIISLIVGLLAITNYSQKKEDLRVYDLGNELESESAKILDYGAIKGNYPWDDFTKNFSDYAGKDIKIIFLTGTTSIYSTYFYNETGKQSVDKNLNGDIVNITENNINYEFKLRTGENFYFIMSQEIGGERYVFTN